MGQYNLLRALQKINEDIQTCDRRLAKQVEVYTQNIMGYLGMDKLLYEKNKAILQQTASLASAAICFVPVFGPTARAAISAIMNAPSLGKGARGVFLPLLSGVAAALQYNAGLMTNLSDESNFNLGRYFTNGMQSSDTLFSSQDNIVDTTLVLMTGGSNMIASGLALGSYLVDQGPGESKGAGKLLVPATDSIVERVFVKYEQNLKESIQWINNDRFDRSQLIYLVFNEIVSGMAVGGRGNLLLDTGAATNREINAKAATDDIDDADYLRIRFMSVEDIKKELGRLVASQGRHRGSRLYDTFNKFRKSNPQGQGLGYLKWFPDPQNPNPSMVKDRHHFISSICLFKARLIAYADDYIDKMKGMFGENWKSFAMGSSIEDLPAAFKTSGHTWTNEYVTAIGKYYDQSDYKKHYVLGAYAFHSILLHHLGTYNLSAFPSFGTNSVLDQAVRKALVDALLTQWWVCSYAYKSGSGKELRNDKGCFAACMFSAKQIKQLPYIAPYFNRERAWKSMGEDQAIFEAALEELKASIVEKYDATIAADKIISKKLPQQAQRVDYAGYLDRVEDLIRAVNVSKDKLHQKNLQSAVQQGLPQPQPPTKYNEALDKLEAMRTKLATDLTDDEVIEHQKKILASYGSAEFGGISINTEFLLSLMPTNKNGAAGLADYIFKDVLAKLYEDTCTYNNALDTFRDAKRSVVASSKPSFNFKKRIEDKYVDFLGNKPIKLDFMDKAQLEAHYKEMIGNVEQDIGNKITQSMVLLDMGTKLSAAGSADFSQADFNREVLKVLKNLIKLMSKR